MENKLTVLLEKLDSLRSELMELGKNLPLTDPKMIQLSEEVDRWVLDVQTLLRPETEGGGKSGGSSGPNNP